MALPTKYKYNEIIGKLEKAINLYEQTSYKYNEFKLYLSNSEVIEFKFSYGNIAHLLGINITTLIAEKIVTETKSYEMLKEIILKKDLIYEKCKNGYINYDSIFSEYIDEKIDSFETVLKFEMDSIAFICKYNKNRTYTTGEVDSYGCDYYIAIEDEEMKYIFLGLKQIKGKYFVPASVIVDSDKNNSILKKVVENQQIIMLNELRLINLNKRYYLKNYEKLALLHKLSKIADENNSNLIVTSDLIHFLRKILENRDSLESYDIFIQKLTRSIINRQKFDSIIDLPTEDCENLIRAYNLLEFNKNSDLDIGGTLSELRELKKQLEQANIKLQEQELTISQLRSDNEEKQGQILSNKEELKNLRQFKDEAFQLIKKYN